jgi:hypothetical protein
MSAGKINTAVIDRRYRESFRVVGFDAVRFELGAQ